MRLFEITNLIKPEKEVVAHKGDFPDYDQAVANAKARGDPYGFFSSIEQDEEPHTVTKTAHNPNASMIDSFWQYLEEIEKRDLMNNPHFPRFYIKKEIIDKGGSLKNAVQMEKLEPLNSMSLEEATGLFERYFGDPRNNKVLDALLNKVERKDLTGLKEKPINSFLRIFSGYVEASIVANREAMIQDDTLKEAVIELKKIKSTLSKAALWDINIDNMMIRRTPHGSQLVFTDPFA